VDTCPALAEGEAGPVVEERVVPWAEGRPGTPCDWVSRKMPAARTASTITSSARILGQTQRERLPCARPACTLLMACC